MIGVVGFIGCFVLSVGGNILADRSSWGANGKIRGRWRRFRPFRLWRAEFQGNFWREFDIGLAIGKL